jgi:hypothetical protein
MPPGSLVSSGSIGVAESAPEGSNDIEVPLCGYRIDLDCSASVPKAWTQCVIADYEGILSRSLTYSFPASVIVSFLKIFS